ncbi:DUF2535 family protein [Aeribacillus composti]|uniref:DUF2535 family protein n=1 Tax=Aeribacillus composti TaxID=1868734 RepID=A0ABY9WEN8_9BACI|nr:DUF2535 family protein [Aeribacillus composti]MDR9794508.1 DUF2535 family protein [Aeribacillus pallidus]MED0651451.1 DUF2535 family protein [Aeribacillus composti]MED4486649.1 DUF2535 family protein [Aeribacillus pallidus]WNF34624.1 DUF2535 family protein [Aeribacillus composti]
MLFKSLEFKLENGQKVKIVEIPVLEEDNSYRFMLNIHMQLFIANICKESKPKSLYNFRSYLKHALKWKDYESIFQDNRLKHNA